MSGRKGGNLKQNCSIWSLLSSTHTSFFFVPLIFLPPFPATGKPTAGNHLLCFFYFFRISYRVEKIYSVFLFVFPEFGQMNLRWEYLATLLFLTEKNENTGEYCRSSATYCQREYCRRSVTIFTYNININIIFVTYILSRCIVTIVESKH